MHEGVTQQVSRVSLPPQIPRAKWLALCAEHLWRRRSSQGLRGASAGFWRLNRGRGV